MLSYYVVLCCMLSCYLICPMWYSCPKWVRSPLRPIGHSADGDTEIAVRKSLSAARGNIKSWCCVARKIHISLIDNTTLICAVCDGHDQRRAFPAGRHAGQTNWFVQISRRARARQFFTRSPRIPSIGYRSVCLFIFCD